MNNENNLNDILQRLNSIEKKNKMLRLTNYLLLLLLVTSTFIGWQSLSQYFQILETESIVFKDKKGAVLATLGINEKQKSFEFKILNPIDKKPQMNLTQNGIFFSSGNKESNFGFSGLAITSRDAANIEQSIFAPGSILLSKSKSDDTSRIAFSASNNIIWFGEYQKGSSKFQPTSYEIFDKKGNIRTVIGTTMTKDAKGKAVTHPESSIWLFDDKGRSVFSAPIIGKQ